MLGDRWLRVVGAVAGAMLMGCDPAVDVRGAPRSAVQRDVEGYAIAKCLTLQVDAFLKDQGDAWGAVIVQRMKGDVDALAAVAEQVERAHAVGDMAVIRDESQPQNVKALPILHCGEVIDRPAVRLEIQRAVVALGPSYGQK